ncbi:hypothetical protein [Variovorax saccharolyticus]|uniref:hypothetical protein n=1 Tax=Variovorax saccharolyticus TaxID=3053516 RepID=UPI00257495FF|nr:hypothetical protein [Variovorax sp. J31P216]MDM0030501.1 hypothetical protein [Variovorax sp. J31P216]
MQRHLSHSLRDRVKNRSDSGLAASLVDDRLVRDPLDLPPIEEVWVDADYLIALLAGLAIGSCVTSFFFFF